MNRQENFNVENNSKRNVNLITERWEARSFSESKEDGDVFG